MNSNPEDLRDLLKIGYVVQHSDGELCKIEINDKNELIVSGPQYYFPIKHSLDANLQHWRQHGYDDYSGLDIKTIYGYCKYNQDAYKIGINGRKVIWERPVKIPDEIKLDELEYRHRELALEIEMLRKKLGGENDVI